MQSYVHEKNDAIIYKFFACSFSFTIMLFSPRIRYIFVIHLKLYRLYILVSETREL